MVDNDRKIKKYILLMVVIVLLVLIACGGLVYYVDPFFHYHTPLQGFEYVVDNQLTQNPGMAEHMDYDSVILGSSMTVNFETDWFKELMDLNTLKLSYSSAYPKDIANILDKIYNPDSKSSGNIKKVFLGVDIVTYSGDVNETKYPLPKYLYDQNPINDIKYLLNKDVLLNYVIRPIVAPEPMNLSHIYASWWTDEYYNEEWVLRNHDAILTQNPDTMDSHGFDEGIMRNLNANIIPYIEAHPETEFVIFFPPYSILFWNDAIMDGHLEASLNSYKCIADALNKYDNVKMYFFPVMAETVTDLNNYADYTHYHPSVNRYMAECFVNDTYVIKKADGRDEKDVIDEKDEICAENADTGEEANEVEVKADAKEVEANEVDANGTIDKYIQKMQEMINGYDFETLRGKIREYRF